MEIPYETTPRRDTGLFNSKLGIWLFLASEVMLFGGLFSAYVFLRVGVIEGVDNPWPWGINVHKTFVVIGFVNTVVLIISSVFVVFGWVALKERNWKRFQLYMYMTVACAAIFMGFKTVEYRSKLTQHHDIRLVDNSVMQGKILNGSSNIPFEATSATFSLMGSAPGFTHDIEGNFPHLTATWTQWEGGEKVEKTQEIHSKSQFKTWFVRARTKAKKDLAAERKRYRGEIAAKERALYAQQPFEEPKLPDVSTNATIVAAEPFDLSCRRTRVTPAVRSDGGDKITYTDGCTLTGKAGDDSLKFEPHYVDMQLVPLHKQEDSMVWEVLGDSHAKEAWYTNRDKAYKEMEEHYASRNREIPERMLRGYYINIQSIHDKKYAKSYWEQFIDEFKAGAGWAGNESHESHGDKHGDDDHGGKSEKGGEKDGHGGHSAISVPRDQVKFFNSHGPRNGNYYAIYFTITALHGLHVIGGALVLLYFVVFGKKLYLKNPEHLANRVEVGGLFWHFVDLIWIFLFPLMYLL